MSEKIRCLKCGLSCNLNKHSMHLACRQVARTCSCGKPYLGGPSSDCCTSCRKVRARRNHRHRNSPAYGTGITENRPLRFVGGSK